DREAGVHRAARRVDVHRDVLVGILRLQVQELGDDQVGDLIVDGSPQEDDPLVEEAAVDVECALSTGGLLDDHRYELANSPRCFCWQARIPADSSNAAIGAYGRKRLSYRASRAAGRRLRDRLCPGSTASGVPWPARR